MHSNSMTQDTFVQIIRAVIGTKAQLTSFKDSKLVALGREYGTGKLSPSEAVERLKGVFSDDFDLGRHEYAEIEKRLERY